MSLEWCVIMKKAVVGRDLRGSDFRLVGRADVLLIWKMCHEKDRENGAASLAAPR